jgi:MarR family transcriptional regulator for hemolysin
MLQAQAYRALNGFMSSFLQPYKLSLPQWKLLGLVSEAQSGVTSSELAELLAVDRPMITTIVNDLKKKDLVLKHADTNDGRSYRITLSPTGAALASEVEVKLRAAMKEFLVGINPLDLICYLSVLSQLAAKHPTNKNS